MSFDYVVMPDPLSKERTGKPKWSKFYERVHWEDNRRPPRNWKRLQVKESGGRVTAWYRPIPPFDISEDPCGTWLIFSDLDVRSAVFMVLKVRNPTFPETPMVCLNEDGSVSAVPKIETDGTETVVELPFEIATTFDYDLVIEQDTTLGKFCRPDGSPLHVRRPTPERSITSGNGGDQSSLNSTPGGLNRTGVTTPKSALPSTPGVTRAPPTPPTLTVTRTPTPTVVTPASHHLRLQPPQLPQKRRCEDSGNGSTDSADFPTSESPMHRSSSSRGGDIRSRSPQSLQKLSELVKEAVQPSLDHLRNLIIAKLETIERTTNSLKGSAKQEFKKVLDAVNKAPAEVTALLVEQQQKQQQQQLQEQKQQQEKAKELQQQQCLLEQRRREMEEQEQLQRCLKTPVRPKQVAFGGTTILSSDYSTPTSTKGGDKYGETHNGSSRADLDSSASSGSSGIATYSCEETDLAPEILNHRFKSSTPVTTTATTHYLGFKETPRSSLMQNSSTVSNRGRGGVNAAPGFYGISSGLTKAAPKSFRHSAVRRGGGGGVGKR